MTHQFVSQFTNSPSDVMHSGQVIQPSECPGLYCGRREIGIGEYSDCGACPRGSRPLDSSICGACEENPTFYDWLYLGFMAQLSLLLHFFFIDYTNSRKKSLVVLHLSAILESVLAGLLTLLLADPVGLLQIRSCSVARLEDWYTMFYNPAQNYTTTLHCTQEIVYPLYTLVMIYYAFSLLLLMLVRPLVSIKFVECRGTRSIYAALYFLPILIVVQAVFGGLIYYSFPIITIICSLVTSAIHMASGPTENNKDMGFYIVDNFCDLRRLTVLVGHWLLHSYGIIALTELQDPSRDVPLLLLVLFPVFFYIGTSKFSCPENLEKIE